MGSELSRADLIDHSLTDRDYFEMFFLLFYDKIDSYRDYNLETYQYLMKHLDILLFLSRKTQDTDFLEECCESQGEYYTLEIVTRLRDLSDLIEWIAKEYDIAPIPSASTVILQHPIFFIEPPLEIMLKNVERIIRWYKRYNRLLIQIDQQTDPFTQKFFFSCCCDSLAEKVKMIY
jgi:hypothetical protein